MSRPSTVSSAPLVRYSCARWIGLRVWKPTTRFQPRSANVRRVSAGSSASSGNGGVGPLEDGDLAGQVERLLLVEPRDARVLGRRSCGSTARPRAPCRRRRRPRPRARRRACRARRRARRGRRSAPRRRRGRRAAPTGSPFCEAHVVDDAAVVVLAHEALERRERARGDHVQVGQLARRERDDLERVDVVRPVARAVDEVAAVRPDQLVGDRDAHAATCARTRPSSSSLATISCARLLRLVLLGVDHELRRRRAPRTGRRRR